MASLLYTDEYIALRRELIKARQHEGLTQGQLATRLGRSQTFVSKYEQGERRLDIVEFLLICKALSIDPAPMIRRMQKGAKE